MEHTLLRAFPPFAGGSCAIAALRPTLQAVDKIVKATHITEHAIADKVVSAAPSCFGR
jgi:F420-0:gamma-glutamyl ligase